MVFFNSLVSIIESQNYVPLLYLRILVSKEIPVSLSIVLKQINMNHKGYDHKSGACQLSISAVRDTLYVLSGKWKLPIIIALSSGPTRFKDLQRELQEITPKVLSKELKELELNEFVTRTVYATSPVTVEYELTEYSQSLNNIISEMREWGLQHRKRLMTNSRTRKKTKELQEA